MSNASTTDKSASTDIELAELLDDSREIYREAKEQVKKYGLISSSSGSRMFPNPAIIIMNDAHKNIFRILKLLRMGKDSDTEGKGEWSSTIPE
jgi:phage terminase small subunit